jgi:hypothetical protein
MRRSFKGHNYKEVALACLCITCKLTDFHIKLRDLLKAFARCYYGIESFGDKDYKRWKDGLIFFEEYILVTLCFDMECEDVFTRFSESLHQLQC